MTIGLQNAHWVSRVRKNRWRKNLLVNYSNCFLKIFVYCTYGKGDIGKRSPVVSQTCIYKRTTTFGTLKNPLGELQ